MSSDKRRVQFRASEKLVERADVLATVLGTDRTEVLTDALREYLRDTAGDDRLVQEIAGAYYDEEITFDQLRELVGPERAANFRVLKRQLDDDLTEELADL
jgi:predicted transcriptional regulator